MRTTDSEDENLGFGEEGSREDAEVGASGGS